MQAPLVSVLLPVRDAEATLGAALRSVARQSEPRFECVVVDDGSQDASRARAGAFAARDPRFRVRGLNTGPAEEVLLLKLVYFYS